jgi:hypothetical protein
LSKHSLSVDRKSEDRKRSANLRLKPAETSQKQADKKQGQTSAKTTAKKKLKTLQDKKSNNRLARLEKMYQELTEIEAKGARL